MEKNIIIVGNGFDRSLGLETSYEAFIKFVDKFTEKIIQQSKNINDMPNNVWVFEENYEEIIDTTFEILNGSSDNNSDKELYQMKEFFLRYFPTYQTFKAISDNTFIKYLKFLQEKSDIYETNWNNIERAIMELAEAIEYLIENVGQANVEDFLYRPREGTSTLHSFKSFSNYLAFYFIEGHFSFPLENSINYSDVAPIKDINEKLLEELEYLTLLLEFYLIYIQKKQFPTLETTEFTNFLDKLENKKFITFNYTQVIDHIFKEVNYDDIHHIHGRIRTGEYRRYAQDNNMIFGIEDKTMTNVNPNVIGYQKFYQRILKQTGSKYETFFKREIGDVINVIVFGHSVDPVDKEIFDNIFKMTHIDTSHEKTRFIFMYHSEQSKREIIKNLATILGKDRLVRLTGQEKIIFNHTQDIPNLSKSLLHMGSVEISF